MEFGLALQKEEMKISCPVLITIITLVCFIPKDLAAQDTYPETVYRHKAKFPRIFKSGELASTVQLCDPKSVCVGTGLFIMERASVGEVKKCVMYLYVVKDTIISCRIHTKDENDSDALYRQAVKDFGDPAAEGFRGESVWYKWTDMVVNGNIITTTIVITGEHAEFRHWHEATNAPVASD